MQVGEAELRETLRAMLAAHGVDCEIDGEWIQVRGHDARMQGYIRTDPANETYTQLDIYFEPWPGTLICESFGGFASTHEERIRDGLCSFAGNTLHVWLTVFLGKDCGEHVGRFEFTNNGIARVAVHGNVASRGSADLGGNWFDQMLQVLATQPISSGTHWVRFFHGQSDGKRLGLEVLLDNYTWAEGFAAAESVNWPKGEGFASVRVFLVLQGGLDLRRAVGILAKNPQADNDTLEGLMIAAGFSATDARRAVIIVPMAFGKVLLDDLVKFPDTCEVRGGKSSYTTEVAAIPGFLDACNLAREAKRDGTMTQEQFGSIAFRDAVTDAVNQALNAGSAPADIRAVLSVYWDDAEPFAPSASAVAASKPWWKLW